MRQARFYQPSEGAASTQRFRETGTKQSEKSEKFSLVLTRSNDSSKMENFRFARGRTFAVSEKHPAPCPSPWGALPSSFGGAEDFVPKLVPRAEPDGVTWSDMHLLRTLAKPA